MSNAKPIAGKSEWQAMQLQLIAFPADPRQAMENDWWQHLIGTESELHRRKLEREETGVLSGNMLKLAIDPLRVNWLVAPIINLEGSGNSLPFIGEFLESVDRFSPLMCRWLDECCPPINRLAFAGKVFQATNDKADSYERLGRYLPSVKLDIDSGDFNYRINRKRESTTQIPGLKINRLMTWSAVTFSMYARVTVGGASQIADMSEQMGCLLEFDINTIQEFGSELPKNRLVDIWNELICLTKEIATSGDVK